LVCRKEHLENNFQMCDIGVAGVERSEPPDSR
jgi:hypothetical protein